MSYPYDKIVFDHEKFFRFVQKQLVTCGGCIILFYPVLQVSRSLKIDRHIQTQTGKKLNNFPIRQKIERWLSRDHDLIFR